MSKPNIDTELLHDLKNVGIRLTALIDLYRDKDITESEFCSFMEEIKEQVNTLWKS